MDSRLTIILVCRNLLALTKKCIASVRAHTRRPYELVVVDNGSTDGTVPFLRAARPTRLIANCGNLGFAKAVNQGLRVVPRGDVLILNNDVVVSPGYDLALRAALAEDPSLGVVGPSANLPSPGFGSPGRCADPPRYRDRRGFLAYAARFAHENKERRFPTPAASLSCFCHLLRREMIEQVGVFDESYPPYYEDTDLFYRASRKGWGLALTGGAYVHHFWHATYRHHGQSPQELATLGRRRFQEKWGRAGLLAAKGYRFDEKYVKHEGGVLGRQRG